MSEIPRTYPSWLKGEVKSAQKEYTEPTKLLADDGTLLSPGWARHMVFDYDRTKSTPTMRRKEWDFYQISDGRYMIQISFANISIGGYASAALVDLRNPKKNKKLAAGTLTSSSAEKTNMFSRPKAMFRTMSRWRSTESARLHSMS